MDVTPHFENLLWARSKQCVQQTNVLDRGTCCSPLCFAPGACACQRGRFSIQPTINIGCAYRAKRFVSFFLMAMTNGTHWLNPGSNLWICGNGVVTCTPLVDGARAGTPPADDALALVNECRFSEPTTLEATNDHQFETSSVSSTVVLETSCENVPSSPTSRLSESSWMETPSAPVPLIQARTPANPIVRLRRRRR